jgi:hypothetical protein
MRIRDVVLPVYSSAFTRLVGISLSLVAFPTEIPMIASGPFQLSLQSDHATQIMRHGHLGEDKAVRKHFTVRVFVLDPALTVHTHVRHVH